MVSERGLSLCLWGLRGLTASFTTVPAPQLQLLGSWARFPADYLASVITRCPAMHTALLVPYDVDHDDCSDFHVQMWPLG